MKSKHTLLVVDKEAYLAEFIEMTVNKFALDLEVVRARSAEEAFKILNEGGAEILLASTRIPERRSFDRLIGLIHGAELGTVTITMTGGKIIPPEHGNEIAQEQFGTDFLITKPFDPKELAAILGLGMERLLQTA